MSAAHTADHIIPEELLMGHQNPGHNDVGKVQLQADLEAEGAVGLFLGQHHLQDIPDAEDTLPLYYQLLPEHQREVAQFRS